MKKQLMIFTITALLFIADVAIASDFYGASVADNDSPTAAWKAGIIGLRPIINDVTYDSPASKAGFKKGDIIISINNKDVIKSSDLNKFTDNTLEVDIFIGFKRKSLIIDRLAIETEKVNQINAQRKAATVTTIQSPYVNEHPDKSPPIKFDDAALEKRYGKTTPAEYARRQQITDADSREEKKILRQEKQKIEAEKLAKINCIGDIPGECGPGRACVYDTMYYMGKSAKLPGVCKTDAEADRMVSESNQRNQNQQLMNQNQQIINQNQDVMRKIDNLNTPDYVQQYKDRQLNDKLDRIDQKLRYGL